MSLNLKNPLVFLLALFAITMRRASLEYLLPLQLGPQNGHTKSTVTELNLALTN